MVRPSKLEFDEVIEEFSSNRGNAQYDIWTKTYFFFHNLDMGSFFYRALVPAVTSAQVNVLLPDEKSRREYITASLLNYVEENGPLL